MSLNQLEPAAWQSYFDHMAHIVEGKRAEIEIDALAIGAQIEAEWLPLIGITYDRRNDLVEVALEGLDHLIHHPRTIWVEQVGSEMRSMEVLDSEEYRHIVRLRDPLMLPSNLAASAVAGIQPGQAPPSR